MVRSIIKDKGKRLLYKKYECKRRVLKSIISNLSIPLQVRMEASSKLSKLPRNSSIVRVNNRCIITGRAKGVLRHFKLSRIQLRDLASFGLVPGVGKSSW